MNKRLGIIIFLIGALALLIGITFKLSKESLERQKEILAQAQIVLVYDEKTRILNRDDIILYGENFQAVLDTSSSEPTTHMYTGVQLKDLLNKNKVDFQNKTIIVKAADGYSVAYSFREVAQDKNVYIAYMEDGKYLGSRDSGGRGPYESIVVSDMFSNRRCKWITEIEVK